MVFFGGAVNYTELREMPLPELAKLHDAADSKAKRMEKKGG